MALLFAFPTMFLKAFSVGVVKSRDCVVGLNGFHCNVMYIESVPDK